MPLACARATPASLGALAAALCNMSSSPPVIRQISWVSVIPQLAILGMLILLMTQLVPRNGMVWGASIFLMYSFGSRFLISRHHAKGMALIRENNFQDAIQKFLDSLAFFDRHPWIDRFRSIVLMSSSKISYTEMALANIAFCYSQIGDGASATAYYQKCLARFPNSSIANAALNMLSAGKNA